MQVTSLSALEEALERWVCETADQRVHGTTGRRPMEMFEEERDLLKPHGAIPRYQILDRTTRQVARDCMVQYETNRYSVTFRFVGKTLEVQGWNDRILIFYDNMLVVSHEKCEGQYQRRILPDHYHGIFHQEDLVSPALLHFDRGPLTAEEVEVRDLGFYEQAAEGGAL